MPKLLMSEVRAKFPMYADLSDEALLGAVRRKFYADIPMNQFAANVDFDTERARLQRELLDEMGWGGQFLAGAGKSLDKLGRSARVLLDPRYTRADAEEAERIDKPLEASSGGFWGGLAGDVALTAAPGLGIARAATKGTQLAAQALPRALAATARGAAPYVGAATGGAAVGAATSPEDMAGGAATGAAFGAGGEAAGRVLSSAYGGAKGIVEPLWKSGRERVLKRTLERYATDPAKAAARAANPEVLVPGAMPTLGEATMDPGLIQLQRASQSASPDVASALHEANQQRVGAYREALDNIVGTDAQRTAAQRTQSEVGQSMYGDAFKVRVNMAEQPPEIQARAAALFARPSVQRSVPRAMEEAAEAGLPFDGTTSIRGMHQIKTALDNEIGEAMQAGKNVKGLVNTRDQLVELMDELSGGAYQNAREAYAMVSRPVNQSDVAQQLRSKAFPAISEYSADIARTKPEQYARALEDSMGTVRRATGLKSMGLEQVMEPEQLATVRGIGKDMGRYTAVQEAARVPGSPTAQYMAAQNVLRGFLGPLGLPSSALDSQLGKLASGLAGLPYRWTEPQLQQMLAKAFTDPREAARLMAIGDTQTVMERLRPYMSQAAVQIGNQP